MSRIRVLLLCLAAALAPLASSAWGQALVRLVLPTCAAPGSTVWLEVQVQLEASQTLKVYDVRIPFDQSHLTMQTNLIDYGTWFPAGFTWCDIQNGQLIVNAGILGVGQYVTGGGMLFRLPVVINSPQLADLGASVHDLYDAAGLPFPSLALPAALQAPCTSFNLRINYLPTDQVVHLSWDAQSWTQAYQIYAANGGDQAWEWLASTIATQWTDPVNRPGRIYRVRSLFTP